MKIRRIFNIFILSALFCSCSSTYRSIIIETSQPSSNILPSRINSLTLMNHSINNQFRNFDEDSLQMSFYAQNFNVKNTVILDSLAADTTLNTLGHLLFENGRYNVVIPEKRNITRHDDNYYEIQEDIDWNTIKDICKTFHTDALLVIERYYNKINTSYKIYPSTEEYYKHVVASIDSKYSAAVKIYDPLEKKVIRQFEVTDTISWSDGALSTKNLFEKCPTIKNCIIQSGIQAAKDINKYLSPVWKKEERIFYVIDKEENNKIIEKLVSNNEWSKAYNYWLLFTKSPKKQIKSKADFNIAVASEMLGNIDEAIMWAKKSNKLVYRYPTELYIKKLIKRKEILLQFDSVQ
ncbi:MAG: hypothetical protein JJE45_07345 [Prolixibacteraceae bacterium]|nr:hypothetical protein [Prolixibacteraceae bacterium]